jgi:CBS domain-containing protein
VQTVRDVMTTDVEYCTPLDNVYEVAVKMRDLDVGAIPIVENDRLIGLITDRDLVVRGIAEKRSGSNQVTNVMSENLITVSPSTSVEEAAQLMAKHQIRRLPVVENGKLVGMVSLGDLATNQYSDQSAGRALSEVSEQHYTH